MTMSDHSAAESPLVSVIVPSYNHQEFLPRRLRSIAEQTYQNIEVIVLDDASQDGSQSTLKQFCENEPRVKHQLFNAENSGQPILQWIKGVNLARGKYVWIAESDDFCEDNFLTTLVAALERNEKAGIAYCACNMVDRNDNRIGKFELESPIFERNLWNDDFTLNGKMLVSDYFVARNIIPNASTALFNRELLEKHIEAGKELRLIADWLIYVNIAMESEIVYINKALNSYRIHDTSTTRTYSVAKHRKIVKERLKIFRAIIQKVDTSERTLRAFKYMMSNRNKFHRAEKVFQKLAALEVSSNQLAFYGYNDLTKYIIEREQQPISPRFIIDQGKANNQYNSIPITALDNADLSDITTIAVMSLRYSTEMCAALINVGFKGYVVTV